MSYYEGSNESPFGHQQVLAGFSFLDLDENTTSEPDPVPNARPALERIHRSDSSSSLRSSDAASIFSIASGNSSSSTNHSINELIPARDELVSLLTEDDVLKSLHKDGLQSGRIRADRFENNYRRLLKIFSRDLNEEAHDVLEKAAAALVGSSTKYVASFIRKEHDPYYSERTRQMDGLKCRPIEQGQLDLERYLQQLHDARPESVNSGPSRVAAHKDDGYDSSSSEDDFDEGQLINLSRVKDFMVSSNAFEQLRNNLQQFVHPPATNSQRRNRQPLSWTARLSCCQTFSVWPLIASLLETPVTPGIRRIRWQCVCTPWAVLNIP